MARCKGTDVVTLRKLLAAHGDHLEDRFVERLSPRLAALYRSTLRVSWLAAEDLSALYETVVPLMYPNTPEGYANLGRALAKESFSGVYRFLLRLQTVPFVIKQAAAIWRTYHDTGEASVELLEKNHGYFVVRDNADLPLPLRQVITGHLMHVLELTGARNLQATLDGSNSAEWRWHLTWE